MSKPTDILYEKLEGQSVIDLHVHTCYSDGEHTPKEVIEIAKDSGISAISITDHDSVNGVKEAILEGEKANV